MRTILRSSLVIALFAAVALGDDKPNFSGEWALNIDKSNLGPMPPPTSMTRKVDHSDPALSFTEAVAGTPQGDVTTTVKVTTDGKESTNQMMGNPAKTTANWDGGTLVISMSMDFQGTEVKLVDKWALGEDGKTLTDNRHIVVPQGEFDVTYVLNKK
jgi:hypothetical protein